MSRGPWTVSGRPCDRIILGVASRPDVPAYCVAEEIDDDDAAGITWARNHLRELLDGYSAALDEAKRLRACLLEPHFSAAEVKRILDGQ